MRQKLHETINRQIRPFLKRYNTFIVAFFMGLIITIVWYGNGSNTEPVEQFSTAQSPAPLDTYIPAGFVLVPIQIQNIDSVSAIIGEFAVVDLFAADVEKNGRGIKIASQIKLIRAPLNPEQFAVLVPENKSKDLVQFMSPFFVVLKNPDAKFNPISEEQTPEKKSIPRTRQIFSESTNT